MLKNILITNDDGLTDEGVVLYNTAKRFGDNVYALFPSRQKSAISKAITVHKVLRIHRHKENIYTVNGTPADMTLIGKYYDRFETPDLVLSGVNHGDNAGLEPLLSSGTIGACWEALLHGIPSIAFSIHHGHSKRADEKKLEHAIDEVLKILIPKIRPDVIYNVNIPELAEYNEIVFTNKIEKNRFEVKIEERKDPSGRPYLWIYGSSSDLVLEEGSDFYEIVKNKNISITELTLSMLKK